MEGKKWVLIVDDDPDIVEQMKTVVSTKFNTDIAYSGEEALKKIMEKKYDCIVMDVMMQTLSDGLDTAKKIKENPGTRDIPIIMLTSVNKHYDYRTQIDDSYYPKDKWLDKPVEPVTLLKEIEGILK